MGVGGRGWGVGGGTYTWPSAFTLYANRSALRLPESCSRYEYLRNALSREFDLGVLLRLVVRAAANPFKRRASWSGRGDGRQVAAGAGAGRVVGARGAFAARGTARRAATGTAARGPRIDSMRSAGRSVRTPSSGGAVTAAASATAQRRPPYAPSRRGSSAARSGGGARARSSRQGSRIRAGGGSASLLARARSGGRGNGGDTADNAVRACGSSAPSPLQRAEVPGSDRASGGRTGSGTRSRGRDGGSDHGGGSSGGGSGRDRRHV